MKSIALATCFALCFLTAPVAQAKQHAHNIELATVRSQEMGSSYGGTVVMPLAGGLVGVPLNRQSNIVVADTPYVRMTWVETGRNPITLMVNGTVQYYQDGNWYIVLDSRGHKHKFSLAHLEALRR